MWDKMKKTCAMSIMAVVGLMLCNGCWITKSWRDYQPITGVGLNKGVRTYTGFFVPKLTGEHMLYLRIGRKEGVVSSPINLNLKGEITIQHGGRIEKLSFNEHYDRVQLLPNVTYLILSPTFFLKIPEHSSLDFGKFHVTVVGDVDKFLENNPDSEFVVKFAEGK